MASRATAATPTAWPLDIRLMNGISALVFILSALVLLAAAVAWLVRAPWFPIRGITMEGDMARNSVATIRAVVMPKLSGNFFAIDLKSARSAFETVPWVRTAVVRRVWPDRLAVRLEEHRAVAYWETEQGDEQLVNAFGEVFLANLGDVEDELLPQLSGPRGSAAQVLQMWRELELVVKRLDLSVQRLTLSGRGSWRAELDNAAVIEMGRGTDAQVLERTRRFVGTVPQVTGQFRNRFVYADLRHPDGYALRLQGVSTTTGPTPVRKSP